MMIIEKFIDCTVTAKAESSRSMGFDRTNILIKNNTAKIL